MIRHCKCGARIKKDNVTGLCLTCYRAKGSIVRKKRVNNHQPCLYCKEKKSTHKYRYCDDCREMLRGEGGWHWGQMLGKSWGGDKVYCVPVSEIKYI